MQAPRTGTINATGQYILGLPVSDRVSTWVIQFEDSSFSGSVTIKGAIADSTYTLKSLAYKDMTAGTNSTSAITGSALVLVDSSGLVMVLDCTSYTSGSLSYIARPMVG